MKAAVCVAIGLVLMTVSLPVIPPSSGGSPGAQTKRASTKSASPSRALPAKGAPTTNTAGSTHKPQPSEKGQQSKSRVSDSLPTKPSQDPKVIAGSYVEREPPEQKLCTLNVVDWDIAAILRAISEQTGANLVLLSTPGAKLTLRLSSVPLGEMIHHICALAGLRSLKVGNAIVLASEDQLKKGYPTEWETAYPSPQPKPSPEAPKAVVRTHRLSHIAAAQAAETLTKLFGEGRINAAPGPGANSPELSIRETSQVTGLASGAIEKSSADQGISSKTVVLWGEPEAVAQAVALLEQLDQPRSQVAISVSIHDITNEALKELGLTWTFGDVPIAETDPGNLGFGSFSRGGMSFNSVIKALERTNRAKLLASPTVSVLDGEKAFILIGQRINYPVLVGFTQVGAPIFSREQERVGIYLQVSVDVSEAGEITLVLYPQVSTVTGFLEVNGASYPQVATREAQTTLRLRNGETVVMGGLLKDEEIVDVQKVPLLAEIPIFGELFKRRKATKSTSQVVIAITPQLIGPISP